MEQTQHFSSFSRDARLMIAGEHGMVGSAIKRAVKHSWPKMSLIETPHKDILDFRNAQKTDAFFAQYKPDYVVIAAAKVGGIGANMNEPVQFFEDNILIQTNLMQAAHKHSIKKLLFLGSSCIYPKECTQPMREDMLMSGILEPTNAPYAMAKLAGIMMCQSYRRQYGSNFISCLPTNLYGINDYYDADRSHVIPAMILKFHQAKIEQKDHVTLWGSGTPLREFLNVDDLAQACLTLLEKYNEEEPINIGSNKEISIHDLALMIKDVVEFDGEIIFDKSMPDGTMRKALNNEKINALGWKAKTDLEQGLTAAYKDFLSRRLAD
ncbi:MAG: GDP-fucose synthetase [Micavibrio sp.]|nr:GDP-fucose synthetase [Micavibrio sp.]|tara:strand:- start:754 stop:1722 length:969 start_codon:yes stop_codon:yes gene_type:complete